MDTCQNTSEQTFKRLFMILGKSKYPERKIKRGRERKGKRQRQRKSGRE